jgi:Txe/YoeB family toxin of Txe-Axe toxin-antitoxin module
MRLTWLPGACEDYLQWRAADRKTRSRISELASLSL